MSQSAPLVPCRGTVSVWLGDTLLARSAAALLTDRVEANATLLLPAADMLVPVPAGDAADPVAWSHPQPGPPLVAVDARRCRIVIDDRWEGSDGCTVNRFPRWGDIRDLLRLIDVQPGRDGRFVAPPYGDTRRNVVEGGQLLAQSIVAAAKSVPGKRVVSAHIVLSRPAVFDRPLDLAVDLHRDGRSFATAAVQATQDGKPISSALVLLGHGAPDVIRGQVAMPDVPGPEAALFHDYGLTGRESRFVNGDYDPDPDRIGPPELHCWIRHREAPAELCLQQAMLAQSITHFTIAAAMLPHPGVGEALAHVSLSTGILTATLTFHEDADIAGWLLYANPAIYAGRGLAQGEGHVFARDGRLVASYTATAMIRAFDQAPDAIGLDSTRLM